MMAMKGKDNLSKKSIRNSNIEMLRIISMLLIIAHHFVVNSGVVENFNYQSVTVNMLFLQLFGMWGKTAINVFVLISGYFLCEMTFRWQRWFKVWLQYKSYQIIIFIVFMVLGYESFSFVSIINLLFSNAKCVNAGFVPSFLFFYMLVPFYNVLISVLNKRNHMILVGILVVFYVVFGTFLFTESIFTESSWYFVLFLISAWIRKYNCAWINNNKLIVILFISCVLIAFASVVIIDYLIGKYGFNIEEIYSGPYYMIADSNKILAFMIGLLVFLFFRNLKLKSNRYINNVAATSFGVLCIHASSDAMRCFLWKDTVNVSEAFFWSFGNLVIYSVAVVFLIFSVCSLIDFVRIVLIERPLFRWIDKKTLRWKIDDRNIIKRFLACYNNISSNIKN